MSCGNYPASPISHPFRWSQPSTPLLKILNQQMRFRSCTRTLGTCSSSMPTISSLPATHCDESFLSQACMPYQTS